MTATNHLDFLYLENKFISRYSDWITFNVLDTVFESVEKRTDLQCLELFPEYQSRLNYIQNTFGFKTSGCEFHENYKTYFKQFTDKTEHVIVNNFFEKPTQEKFDLIFFKPLLSKFLEKETLLMNIRNSLKDGGQLLFIDIFSTDLLTPGDLTPSNYHYMFNLEKMLETLEASTFKIIETKDLTEKYSNNQYSDMADNRDNQIHTPIHEIEKNISILRDLTTEKKITINSIYCTKD